ncbi:MAG: transporter substrate-binding domain-containing protein [Clostridia bacterium]|nr:transporter substrate-binding domain-containing protein [Clostridia bacterium]
MTKTTLGRLLGALLAVLLLIALTGCAKQPAEETSADTSLATVLDRGALILGLDASFPPMGFTDENGEIVGFDIDVAQEVCDRLGIRLVKKPINWSEKEDLLNGREIDCIWNGMSSNASRAAAMALSDPYMTNEMIFVVSGSGDIRAMNHLSGKTVGVQRGSTAQELLEAADIVTDVTVAAGDDNVALLDELEKGTLDAVFLDSVVAYYTIASGDRALYILPGNLAEEDYVIGFRKGDLALRDKGQSVIYDMNVDGKLAEISDKWFGSDITSLK